MSLPEAERAVAGVPAALVSVITPVRDGGRFIGDALDSLIAQSWPHWEALVIDDGSRDDTAAQVARFAERDSRIRLLHHPQRANCGVSRSRRLGLDEARGEFIAFLDADDTWSDSKLERQVAVMREHDATPPVLCHTGIRALVEDDSDSPLPYEAEFNFTDRLTHYEAREQAWFGQSSPICTSSVLCRAAALRGTVRGFEQLFQYEDWTWWTLMSVQGLFVFLPEPLTGYRVHAAAATAQVRAEPLRQAYSKIEHWLAVAMQSEDASLRELAIERLSVALAEAAVCYREPASPRGADEAATAALDRAALLERLGECERELARLRRFWPRRLVGWWRRRRTRRLEQRNR